MNGHFRTVEYLIEQGALINQLNYQQHPPLILGRKISFLFQNATYYFVLYGKNIYQGL